MGLSTVPELNFEGSVVRFGTLPECCVKWQVSRSKIITRLALGYEACKSFVG